MTANQARVTIALHAAKNGLRYNKQASTATFARFGKNTGFGYSYIDYTLTNDEVLAFPYGVGGLPLANHHGNTLVMNNDGVITYA